MLAMAQPQHPTSLEQGSRRLKKGDGKDKLKHRVRVSLSGTFSGSKSIQS